MANLFFRLAVLLAFLKGSAPLEYPWDVPAMQPALEDCMLSCGGTRFNDLEGKEIPGTFYYKQEGDDDIVVVEGDHRRCEIWQKGDFHTSDTVRFAATMRLTYTPDGFTRQTGFVFFQIHNKDFLGYDYQVYRNGVPLMLMFFQRRQYNGVEYNNYLWVKIREEIGIDIRTYETYPLMPNPDGFVDVEVLLENGIAYVSLNGALLHQANLEHLHILATNHFRTGAYLPKGTLFVEYKSLAMETLEIVQTIPDPALAAALSVTKAGSDRDFIPLFSGEALNLEEEPGFSIVAEALGAVGYVLFYLDGEEIRKERGAPYSIAGDKKGKRFYPWSAPLGTHTLTAIAFTSDGVAGPEHTITIDIVDSDLSVPTIWGLTLIRGGTGEDVGPLLDGAKIDLQEAQGFNVRADTLVGSVNRVRYFLNGEFIRQERGKPYTVAGDKNGGYNRWDLPVGAYSLKAVGYNADNKSGPSYTINFEVVGNETG